MPDRPGPEVTPQRLAAQAARRRGRQADRPGRPDRPRGLGADESITVKGSTANAEQRLVIDESLKEAERVGASRRVMIACLMTMTQESSCTRSATNGKHVGPYQQNPAWGTERERRDPTTATRRFLTDRNDGWRKHHGSVKNAPGNLAVAIEAIQRSGLPALYAPHKAEATKTVDAFLGSGIGVGGGTEPPDVFPVQYLFRRGEQGNKESSWDATGRLAEEVRFNRWAARNTLCYASDTELRAGAISVEVHGNEPWLLEPPVFRWSARRATSEVTLRVLADEIELQVGATVMIAGQDALDGRYIVAGVTGDLRTPERELTLRRPRKQLPEPATVLRRREELPDTTEDEQAPVGSARPNARGLVYPLAKHGRRGGGPADHARRPFGNWQSDNAVDILVEQGVAVRAIADGTITRLGGSWSGGSGNPDGFNITLRTADNEWFYTHLRFRSPRLRVGMKVKAGAYFGTSGAANGVDHIHVGVKNGNPVTLLGV